MTFFFFKKMQWQQEQVQFSTVHTKYFQVIVWIISINSGVNKHSHFHTKIYKSPYWILPTNFQASALEHKKNFSKRHKADLQFFLFSLMHERKGGRKIDVLVWSVNCFSLYFFYVCLWCYWNWFVECLYGILWSKQ